MKIMNKFFRSRFSIISRGISFSLKKFKVPNTGDHPDYDGLLGSNRQSLQVKVRFSSNQQKQ